MDGGAQVAVWFIGRKGRCAGLRSGHRRGRCFAPWMLASDFTPNRHSEAKARFALLSPGFNRPEPDEPDRRDTDLTTQPSEYFAFDWLFARDFDFQQRARVPSHEAVQFLDAFR